MEDAVDICCPDCRKSRGLSPMGEDACVLVDLYGSPGLQTGADVLFPRRMVPAESGRAVLFQKEGVCATHFWRKFYVVAAVPLVAGKDPLVLVRRLRLFGWEDAFRDRNGEALDVRFEGSARKTFLSLVEMVEREHRLVLAEGSREARDVMAQSRDDREAVERGVIIFAEIDILPPIRTVPRRGA